MTELPFVHLHCHSHYSILQGTATIYQLVDRAKELGMNALALTDSGNLYGALEFYRYANSVGVKPILGYQAYVARGSRFDRQPEKPSDAICRLTLLAQNRTGFHNLMKLASAAYLDGFHYKPCIDKAMLESHSKGIICLSGGRDGELGRLLLEDAPTEQVLKAACDVATWFQRVFTIRYYIEIQDHGLPEDRKYVKGAVAVAERRGIPLVATNNVHYLRREDAITQDILSCINQGKYLTDEKRKRLGSDQHYLTSTVEIYKTFPGLEDAVGRSQKIADSVDNVSPFTGMHVPGVSLPEGKSADQELRELCLAGLKERYAGSTTRMVGEELAPDVMQRLDHELSGIQSIGLANYFLIFWEIIRLTRERNIPVNGRGPASGSLVCYGLHITDVCPLEHGLLFERFVDVTQGKTPYIDIEVCQVRREEVIECLKEKYGRECVAAGCAIGRLSGRAAIRDVARVQGIDIARADEIVNLMPKIFGMTVQEARRDCDELRRAYETGEEVRKVLEQAIKIEGLARNAGKHCAAIVISDKPLTEHVPLFRVQGQDDPVTQWGIYHLDDTGLFTIHLLGLKHLTVLSKAVELIDRTTGQRIDLSKLPLDDSDTFAMLCRGETKGVFQLESGGIRDLLQRAKPKHFQDIVATLSLYRPGPLERGMVDDYIALKQGQRQAEYLNPVMREVLEETHGVMIFQEQAMQILNRLGGLELTNAYCCIKSICKNKTEDVAWCKQRFREGAAKRGLKQDEIMEIFTMIDKFAGHGFCKSHATSYGLITYQSAYLKAHYPTQFMAALLTTDIPSRNFKTKDDLVEHVEEARRMGIKVVGPDINRSGVEFIVSREGDTGKIVFGLSAIKGCTQAAVTVVEERERNGPFQSLGGFCERMDAKAVSRLTIETLIHAGAFDSLGISRAAAVRALWWLEASEGGRKVNGLSDAEIPEWDVREKLVREKAVLGIHVSGHPLDAFREMLMRRCTHTTTDLSGLANGTKVTVGGMIGIITHSHIKNPRPGSTPTRYAMFNLEDTSGTVRCILWPEPYSVFGELVTEDAVVAVRGTVDQLIGSNDVNLIVREVTPLSEWGNDSRN